ncbi:hypothetical protein [Mesorhizobium sp. CO1-1-8]|uniref:hypothetical protein n=1 Tax=Mesorhizobium sp. CO1-1-8 TaxID=2876631 RepID=UPI001CD0A733|nr:hypothetical protein [Mesorhizobium sp. CO1-1-8]MBZ9775450.1 hypothetical protein [Mesorhizobium sp. CO1-1-8]
MDHTGLVELLDYTQAQLTKIRQAVAASEHAGAMFTIDCLVGAAAEQTKCKLASLEHAGLPIDRDGSIGRDGPIDGDGPIGRSAFEGGAAPPGKATSGKPDARGNRS